MPWFPFKSRGGLQWADVRARLERVEGRSRTIDFLVDSGASRSLVPLGYVMSLLPTAPPAPDVDLGLQDAQGGRIRGKLVQFRVSLLDAPGLGAVEETFGVSDKVFWPVLGLSWFKQVGVHFRNFDSHWRGPAFAVYVDRSRKNRAG